MKLPEDERRLFLNLYSKLLLWTNRELGLAEGVSSPEEFRELSFEKKVEIRDNLWDRLDLIDSFLGEDPFDLSSEKLKIVRSWKENFIRDRFLLIRHLKDYSVFLDSEDPPHAYGVLGLTDDFEAMLGTNLPVALQTVLLPFKGRIVYDGFFRPYLVRFGGEMQKDFNRLYQEAKSRLGIISSLPFEEGEWSDSDRLKFYLQSRENREIYQEEIEELKDKNTDLLKLYHQELGKASARKYGRKLRELGIEGGWFAILEDQVVAGGATKEEVKEVLEKILPEEKREFPYLYHLEEK